ncbi:MAG: L,D-transpeptidase [Hyphomonadaceae bacterium]|jgi:lipoprotein-anchoring transpeptidase ErfK/SrfK|nr:L,D-transpeptidase [Hyphomonadaceae bacterium]
MLIAAINMTWAASQAHAQDAPVFRSDIERQEREREAQRAERRKLHNVVVYPKFMDGGEKPNIAPQKPPVVYLEYNEPPGTIIVDTGGRKLYYVLPNKEAYAYPISVGRDGFTWTGTEKISRIASWPSWTPPPEMRQRQPGLPITVSGGVINPLGAKALYLGNTIYRIHGTNNERSIGRASSSGCFRMMNEHVTHLATLARIGTTVRVVSNYSGASESMPLSALFSGFGFGSDDPPVPQKRVKAKK